MKIRAEFIAKGLVQGVGYRYFVYKTANELGLFGYTKNLYDGSVITVVEGEENTVNELSDYLKRGPERSHVQTVNVDYMKFTGEFINFDIKF